MYRVPPLPPHLDSYEGWRPSQSNPTIAKITNKISPADMWSHFISQRRPVIIDGFLQDKDWNASKWTDLEYLRSVAGQVPVKIEPVHPAAGHFGTSVKRKKVKFAEFLDILQDQESAGKWYLTTQYVEQGEQDQFPPKHSTSDDADSEDSDYEPELDNVLPAPTNALSNDFPAKPELLGNLVLQQCNLWLGNSKQGKSSGLHHDFHDNLYILLSGYKRFLLFPPSAHRYLHPRGLIERVHSNGLIVYAPPGDLPSYVPVPGRKHQLPIRPDGLVPSDAARWRRKARLRVKREIDELAAADAGEGSRIKSQRKGKAKQTRAQELAQEALLQAEAELRICRMDEEGIDPEADTSEDDDYDDDSNPDLEGLLNTLVGSNGAQLAQSSEEEQDQHSDDDDDDDDDNDDDDDEEDQGRKLIASLPTNMKDIGIAALSGDQEAFDKLRAYLDTVADSDPSEEQGVSDQEKESDEQSEPLSEDGLSASEEDDVSPSEDDEDDQDDPEKLLVPKTVPSNGFSRKRKETSTPNDDEESSDDKEGHSESDTVESELSMPAKRARFETASERSEDDDDEEEDEHESQSEQEESSEDEDSGLPTFAGADSGSEFGDVDEGEAELERLLAMAQHQEGADDAESSSAEDEDNEPQSFSRIPPHVLHRCLGVPDDPSRPMPNATNGSAGSRKKKAALAEPYTLMPGCPPPIEVFLKPGQMLYLPASWYHEVTSSSSPPLHQQVDSKGQKQPSSEVHMALNYWFHPPDALEFEPVEPRQASAGGQGRGSNQVSVPGLGVGLGESALEHRGAGTGTHERPYRDAEVWDEVAHAVAQQVKLAKDSASK
ncbi:uncharacterized protein UTRI_04620 [Ustilago trichophora]|uniref:JmjC domain-containing protein n=1 Tax=Ustilago trichophora TaxID=86804 RepID=A0A5C3EE14_9BASI|nr:uncharacterized protein UTRI_04620 [Ustilago trichophora]